ncbi:N-acetylhexosamine 1-kinase [Patescibacteria group bacterium]|nr:N-acetylhexosamine 1-kinase [Patescibacteria group bacterium]
MIKTAALQFILNIKDIQSLGFGLINDTFLINQSLVLQRINNHVFPEPERIMDNLFELTKHIQSKSDNAIKLQVPHVLNTHNDLTFFQDENNNVWRALSFVENSFSIHELNDLQQASEIGFALGHFHYLVSDLKPELLHDTLPNFHIAPSYLAHYQAVLKTHEDEFCKQFIETHHYFVHDLEDAKQQGLLKLRVTHGDPKIDNFLFDKHTQKVVSLIDLDTVKPALVHYDIADCLRSCCHDKTTNEFSLEICTIILSSYLSEVKTFFSTHDYDYLYSAIRLLPFELGLRFYTDYLQNNIYFKVDYAEQNLHRAIEQFKLCQSIIEQETEIKQLINELKC